MRPSATWLLILAAIVTLVCSACSSATKMNSVWKDDRYTKGPIASVMVLGVAEKTENRRLYEDAFVKLLEARGVKALSSLALIPEGTELSKAVIKKAAVDNQLDTVLITRVTGFEKQTERYRTPHRKSPPVAYYYSLDSYYPKVSRDSAKPGYYIERQIAQLESNLYETGTERLIWSAQSEVIQGESVAKDIDEIIKGMLKNLTDNDLWFCERAMTAHISRYMISQLISFSRTDKPSGDRRDQ